MIALFVGGHCLITGLPGTAKTLLVRTMAQTLGLVFKRIQFTPDLMPSDITGTDIIEEDPHHRPPHLDLRARARSSATCCWPTKSTARRPRPRARCSKPCRSCACTVRGNNYVLPEPFFVLATQNPIELEGTYPLPEAQFDRFLFNTVLDYLIGRGGIAGGGPDDRHHHSACRPGDQRRGDPGFPATGAHGADRRERGAPRRGPGARQPQPRRIRARISSRSM